MVVLIYARTECCTYRQSSGRHLSVSAPTARPTSGCADVGTLCAYPSRADTAEWYDTGTYRSLMVCSPSHHPIDSDARCLVARFQGAISSPRLARRWRGSLGLPFPYLSSQAVPRRTKPRASAPKPVAASSQFVPRRGGRPLQLARGGGRAPWEEAIAVDHSGLIAVPSVVVERR